MPLTIRPAEPTDVPAMAELRAQTKGTHAFWTNRVDQYLRGEYSPQKALEPRSAFVATDEWKIVGFVAGHRTRRFDCDGEVQWIDVDQQQRGRGIGYKLMAQIGAWFVLQNAKRICVNVDKNNLPARKLYEKCGARPLNDAWMVWDHSSLICAPMNQ
jgi:ribosomal protein S18 acetylase RimI-like enzyme